MEQIIKANDNTQKTVRETIGCDDPVPFSLAVFCVLKNY